MQPSVTLSTRPANYSPGQKYYKHRHSFNSYSNVAILYISAVLCLAIHPVRSCPAECRRQPFSF